MSIGTFGKVIAGVDLAIGGLYGSTALRGHEDAGDAHKRGAEQTSSALNQSAMFTASSALGFATLGAVSLATHGKAGNPGSLSGRFAGGAIIAGIVGNWVTSHNVASARLSDGRTKDLEATVRHMPNPS